MSLGKYSYQTVWNHISYLFSLYRISGEVEIEQRRLFLWTPFVAGSGVVFYFSLHQEPDLWLFLSALGVFTGGAFLAREHFLLFLLFSLGAVFFFGGTCAKLRTLRVEAPVLDRLRIATLIGEVEQVDFRPQGGRFILRLLSAPELPSYVRPHRVRLSLKYLPTFSAGQIIQVKARLLPPSSPALPNGYDFGRDAYFSGLGAVGSVLGKIEILEDRSLPKNLFTRAHHLFFAHLDQIRNRLAQRIYDVLGPETGAVAVAMVTGKRDFLSLELKERIKQAGIFHIITISGMQMTLVAGIFFASTRRLLALSPHMAARYPLRKWAAITAIVGALLYNLATGARVGTERALFMTLLMLGAILLDRRALSMRNLAFAALFLIILEPESLLGASFQLSFAAVAALISIYERRWQNISSRSDLQAPPPWEGNFRFLFYLPNPIFKSVQFIGHLLWTTLLASTATAPFMVHNFHELSPYVLIGNPLTLTIIEFFAVPGALLGAALYPFHLDRFIWEYVGIGIEFVLWAAQYLASAPGASFYLKSFAPWSIVCFTLALLCFLLWHTAPYRWIGLIFLALGFYGIAQGRHPDLFISPSGEFLVFRNSEGHLSYLGKHVNLFALEQWLRADGDKRSPHEVAYPASPPLDQNCDALGCTARLPSGLWLALILNPAAFQEDCPRAHILVSTFLAPPSCRSPWRIDRPIFDRFGALSLTYIGQDFEIDRTYPQDINRPWTRQRPLK